MNQRHNLISTISLLLCLLSFFATAGFAAAETAGLQNKSFVAFESGHVRPLAISPNGQTLCAVNTPDNRIEVFDIADNTLNHRSSIPVGLEPVAIAMPDNNEAWVVNHLSDSVASCALKAPALHHG